MKKRLIIFLLTGCSLCGYAQDNFAKWRINLSGGIGYDLQDTSEDEKEMTDWGFSKNNVSSLSDDLKLGGQGNADIHYLVNKNWGVGLKYIFFKNDGKIEEIKTTPLASGYGAVLLGTKMNETIHYVGPSLHIRSNLRNPLLFGSVTLSGGYVHYKSHAEAYMALIPHLTFGDGFISQPADNPQLSTSQTDIPGGTLGLSAGVGLEYLITSKVAVGVDVCYFYSSLNNVKIENYFGQKFSLKELNNGKDVFISRLDFSLGLKIYL